MSACGLRQRYLGSPFLHTGFIQRVFSHQAHKPKLAVVFGQKVLDGLVLILQVVVFQKWRG